MYFRLDVQFENAAPKETRVVAYTVRAPLVERRYEPDDLVLPPHSTVRRTVRFEFLPDMPSTPEGWREALVEVEAGRRAGPKPIARSRHLLFARLDGLPLVAGPYLGGGIEVEGPALGPRLLFGFEVGAREFSGLSGWLVFSLHSELGDDGWMVGPGAELSTPLLPLGPGGPPMVGVGLGIRPFYERADTGRAGIRVMVPFTFGGPVVVEHGLDVLFGPGRRLRYRLGVRLSL